MSLRHIFGKNMKSYRFQKKYTQATLAEKADVSTNYISQLERGKHSADFDIIETICDCLDIEPFQLFLKPKSEKLPRRVDMNKK